MKNIRLTKHALEQCSERGATEAEVKKPLMMVLVNLQSLVEKCAALILISMTFGKGTSTR